MRALLASLHSALVALSLCACKQAPRSNGDQAAARAPRAVASSASPAPSAPPESAEPLAKDAREQFEKKWSCPTDRVELKKRSDLEPSQVAARRVPVAPDEVKNDPGRYEKWKADHEAAAAQHRAAAAEHVVFEVTGCGHTQIVDCRPHHAHGAVYPNWADCYDWGS